MKIWENVDTLENFKWKNYRLWVKFQGNLNKIWGSVKEMLGKWLRKFGKF